MALNIDVAPTLLSLAGVEIPPQMQGKDLTGLYTGEETEGQWRDAFFYEHTVNIETIPKSIGVIGEEYKLITYTELESGLEEFYSRVEDPHEKNNLIDDPAYREIIEEYRSKLAEMQNRLK
jgi:arylsulfatase A-like enzyme